MEMLRRRNNSEEIIPPPVKEGGGHAFLILEESPDTMITPGLGWNGVRRRRFLGNRGGGGHRTVGSPEKKHDVSSLEGHLRQLSFTDKELQEVIEDPEQFRSLQSQLRERGAVTNSLVKEGIHFYVQTCLEYKRQSDSPRNMITPTNASTAAGAADGDLRRRGFRTPEER